MFLLFETNTKQRYTIAMIDINYYNRLPKKRMGAGALLLDAQDKLLLVKPTYSPFWLLPGGVVEENESPRLACMREVKEELGLDIHIEKLLCVDYRSKAGERSEVLEFVFYGGVLGPSDIQNIRLPLAELSECRFVTLEQALSLVNDRLAGRLPPSLCALKNNMTAYLEDGQGVL
jgi:ADP-ribose pyrophosphatase YjhB (NUDIX family)